MADLGNEAEPLTARNPNPSDFQWSGNQWSRSLADERSKFIAGLRRKSRRNRSRFSSLSDEAIGYDPTAEKVRSIAAQFGKSSVKFLPAPSSRRKTYADVVASAKAGYMPP